MKGKGKGFGGECWTCDEKGHRSQECPNNKAAIEISSVEKEIHVGRVLAIAQVQVQDSAPEPPAPLLLSGNGWQIINDKRTSGSEMQDHSLFVQSRADDFNDIRGATRGGRG